MKPVDCGLCRLPEPTPALGIPMASGVTGPWGLHASGNPGAAWPKSPDWATSIQVSQFSRSLELAQTPAGQRGGVSDIADPSTTLWLIESGKLTAPHTSQAWSSLLLISWQLIKTWSKYGWNRLRQRVRTLDLDPLTTWRKAEDASHGLSVGNPQAFHFASRFAQYLPMNRYYGHTLRQANRTTWINTWFILRNSLSLQQKL